jgi:hypothetical protein
VRGFFFGGKLVDSRFNLNSISPWVLMAQSGFLTYGIDELVVAICW